MRNLGIKVVTDRKDKITEVEALSIPAVASAIDLIAGSIGKLDFYLVKKEPDNVRRIENDYRLNLLNKQPNESMNAYTFKREIVKDYLLYGASHSVIERDRNTIKGLYLLNAINTTTDVYLKEGYKIHTEIFYDPFPDNQNSKPLKFESHEILSFLKNSNDGITGTGILRQHKDILKKALDESKYSANILRNGAVPIGVLKAQSKLSPQAFANLKNSWAKLYQGTENSGKTVILEEGMDYEPISMNPDQLQLTDSKKDTISSVAKIFNIPETMINSQANKYNSAEENSMNFLHYCVSPIISEILSEINKDLLLENEKDQGYEFKMDTSKLLQLTRKEKADAIAEEYKAGLISFHEARKDLDHNPKTHEDYFRLGLGDVIFKYETDQIIIPNTMQSKANLEAQEELENKENLDPNEIEREKRGISLGEYYKSPIYDTNLKTNKNKKKFIIK